MESEAFDQEAFQEKRHQVVKALLWVFILCGGACSSYIDYMGEIKDLYQVGRYRTALKKLETSALKKQNRNRLLYHLEKAMIYDRLGELKKSRQQFFIADRLVDEFFTQSISKEAASYILSSDTTEYRGEDYEKIFIHTMLALSFIRSNKLQQALVEARRINLKLHEINAGRGDRNNRYNEDAFARYLAALIHEVNTNSDSAFIDYQKSFRLYWDKFKIFNDLIIPRQVGSALYQAGIRAKRTLDPTLQRRISKADRRPRSATAQVVVIHQLGEIANKESREFMLPFKRQVIRFSFPVIVTRKKSFGRTGISLSGKFIAAEQMVNLDRIAYISLEDRRLRITAKQMVRLLAKGHLTEQVHRQLGPLAGVAFNIYAAATETADTRSWSLLPSRILVTRLSTQPNVPLKFAVVTDGVITAMHQFKLKPAQIKLLVSIRS